MELDRDVDNHAQGQRMLAEQRSLRDVEDDAEQPGDADAVAARDCHRPEHQHQRKPVRAERLGDVGHGRQHQHEGNEQRDEHRQLPESLGVTHRRLRRPARGPRSA